MYFFNPVNPSIGNSLVPNAHFVTKNIPINYYETRRCVNSSFGQNLGVMQPLVKVSSNSPLVLFNNNCEICSLD